ncbi:ABC transporter ATP-binding protein/permease [Candidatus Pelagibacter sp.]|jgi:ATP-binding cassette, subfamily B, bacterial PglK|nr:ABC transporter ATP-binding protein/permease [Candidatus Pelagibacter sp.]
MHIFKKILFFLTPSELKKAGLLLILILIMALIDMMGVASILPFMAVLTNPSLIESNAILNNIFQASNVIGIKTIKEFIFFLGILVFLILIFSLSFKAVTIYVQARFIQMREYSISKRLLETYLNQQYSWFLNRNSADLGKSILSEVGLIVTQGLTPMFNFITQIIITSSLIILLLLIDIKLTLIIIFVIGGAYFLIFKLSRKFLNRIGKERLFSNEQRFKAISEAFGASKEVKVGALEKVFSNRFSTPSLVYAKHQATSQIINILPRFFIEGIAFGGMLIIILYIISKVGTFNNAIPIIAVYAFAGYRLMPSLQQIYSAGSTLKFVSPSIKILYEDLKDLKSPNTNHEQGVMQLNKAITLNKINYNYPNSSRTTLRDIDLTIPARKTIGFVGETGCGKTTTVDIILGLLEPQKGTLEIDGKVITKNNKRSWQSSIGYVPQHIYLSDDTIAANIAFGIDLKDINYQSVVKSSKIADLHQYVTNELPNQYQTVIGERGVRLSGGQRQRIGIARALYHNPKVLILDEATSSLDNQTEKAVMDAVNNLSNDITIILIAHRLNTVKNCDIIFKLDKGELISQGTFDEVINDIKN